MRNVSVIDWPRKEIPLAKLTTCGSQLIQLSAGLDPFGDYTQIHGVGKIDNQANDLSSFRVAIHVGNEGTVDLKNVDRKAAQSRKRGMSGTKIIKANPHADVLQVAQDVSGFFRVSHGYGLGNFEVQLTSIQVRFSQDIFDTAYQLRIGKLLGGDVYGYR